MSPKSGPKRLRELLRQPGIICSRGAHDVFTALIVKQAGFETVVARGLNPDKPKIGRDGKRQLNLYDPNLTRVELMEPKPVEKPCCSPMLQ